MKIHVIMDAVSENVHLTLLKIIQTAIVFTLADVGQEGCTGRYLESIYR